MTLICASIESWKKEGLFRQGRVLDISKSPAETINISAGKKIAFVSMCIAKWNDSWRRDPMEVSSVGGMTIMEIIQHNRQIIRKMFDAAKDPLWRQIALGFIIQEPPVGIKDYLRHSGILRAEFIDKFNKVLNEAIVSSGWLK